MQHEAQARKIVDVVKRYYKKQFGALDIGFEQVCFCKHNPSCGAAHSPSTIPNKEENKIRVHIYSSINPEWYPGQLVLQLAHEIWHAYEFSRYGIDYPWYDFKIETEPFAHAASLCILSEYITPVALFSKQKQIKYFNDNKFAIPEDKIYKPGIKIAQDVNYDFKKLRSLYDKKIAPLIEESQTYTAGLV